ncbi:c-type cytochrome biogenesis protein CcsB [Leifsonia sp. Root112D2]|uniref:c-type cytochrome biogenesis protein CcsB n=1 Tax=Leifsonia sp. Root112D2 TaxID=1736426 RepID=UPI000A6817EF|nr:c-type cytochrome biogenesis protein CcsB [Leifsonia sp. Root112D2]
MTETLSQISVFFLFGAMALYAAAFVAFALDLAHRAGQAGAAVAVPSAVERRAEVASGADAAVAGAAGSGRATATLSRLTTRVEEGVQRIGTSRSLRVGFGLTLFAFALHIVADVLRGVAAGRVPWANMYEFSMTGSLFIVAVFLIVNLRYDLRFLGSFVTGLILILLGISTVRYYVAVVPLPPALQSYWLVIHVLVATIATGFFALGFALSAAQLARGWRDGRVAKGKRGMLAFLTTLPSATTLENLAYRVNIVGFILWTFTLMAGSIWAEKAWGRYWGWDTKEVWTFIIWVIYAGYIHARATRGWRGSRSAWLAVIGFAAVLFNFGIVNVFFHGLHAYSGL